MTYVFDIDGTICSNVNGDYEKSTPFLDRIKIINNLYKEGHKIIFHTARGMGRGSDPNLFKDLTLNQLKEWGVNYNKLIMGKPSGDIYIDDKGVNDEKFFSN